jgi:hypothetical protein
MPLMSIQWRVSSCNGCGGSEKLAMTEKSWEKCSLYTRNETDKGQDSRLTAFRGNLAYDSSPMKVPIIQGSVHGSGDIKFSKRKILWQVGTEQIFRVLMPKSDAGSTGPEHIYFGRGFYGATAPKTTELASVRCMTVSTNSVL